MDLHEWVEDVTSAIESNRRAREVRRELLGHLQSLIAELTCQGLDLEQAQAEAVSRMGNPHELEASLRQATGSLLSRAQKIVLLIGATMTILGAIGSLGSIVFSNLLVLPLLLGLVVMAAGASGRGDRQAPFTTLGRGLRRNMPVIIAWGALGLVAGSQPFWLRGTQTPWYLPGWIWPTALAASTAVVVWTTVRAFAKGAKLQSLGTLEAGLFSYAGLSGAIGLTLWRTWPSPASPYAFWYVNPSARLPWYGEPLVTALVTSIGALTIAGGALLVVVWAVQAGLAALRLATLKRSLSFVAPKGCGQLDA